MGLPAEWNLADSLKGNTNPDPTQLEEHVDDSDTNEPTEEPEEDEKTPEGKDGEKPEEGTTEKPEAPAKGKPEGKTAEKPKGKVDPKKPAVKPGKTAAPKPEAKKPAAKTEDPAAVVAAPKIKVGDKEYTQEEITAAMAKKPGTSVVKPEAEPVKAPTPEELEAQRVAGVKQENDWVGKVAKNFDVTLDEPTMDKILTGGPEAVAALKNVIQEIGARAVLLARKSIFADFEPQMKSLQDSIQPLSQARLDAEDEKEWASFSEEYPELASRRPMVEMVMASLVENQPDHLRTLDMAGMRKYTAEQTREFLKSMGIDPDASKVSTAPVPETDEVTTDSEETVEPAPEKKPVVRAKVKPPLANAPVATPGKGAKGKSGDAEIINGLW